MWPGCKALIFKVGKAVKDLEKGFAPESGVVKWIVS
jgi:hypothetical protein